MAVKCPKCQSENPETATFCADCGTKITSPKDIGVTKTIETPVEEFTRGTTFADRYEIIEMLGKGGMGTVYRVEDTKIGQDIALKLIKPEIASDTKTIERFRNELKTTRMISHRNVCRMFDLGDSEGKYFITMEYIPGEDLKSFIRRVGQLPSGKAISIAKQVGEGLAEAHRLGVVHRDLKSNNIMIDKDGNARIMDFGIARSVSAKGLTGEGVIIGTPEYMSPEQAEAKEVDHRSDLYSLGVILYEMVTGELPFEGDTPLSIAMKHKGELPKEPKNLNPQIPEDLNRLILKCLEKDKENRYQSADELFAELNNIEKGILETQRESVKRRPVTSKKIFLNLRLKKYIIPALGIVALAIIVISALLLIRQPSKVPLAPAHKQLTFTGDASYPAISPDGKFIAYGIVRYGASGIKDTKIIVQDIVGGQDIEVLRVYYCYYLRWLPDSSELSFSAITLDNDRGIFVISPLGGMPRHLSDKDIEGQRGYAWSPDSSQYAWAGENQIHIKSKVTGDTKSMKLDLNESILWILDIDWSPEGSFMLILTVDKERKNAIWTISVDGRKQSKIIEGIQLVCPRWSPRGDAIYYQQKKDFAYQCWKIPVSLNTGEASNTPLPILPGIQAGGGSLFQIMVRCYYMLGTIDLPIYGLPQLKEQKKTEP
jgi:serine/threonine protein kinase